jgi:hypothetical protein
MAAETSAVLAYLVVEERYDLGTADGHGKNYGWRETPPGQCRSPLAYSCLIVSAHGSVIVTVVPAPGVLSRRIVPR